MPDDMSWEKAIQQVLGASATPLHYREITDRIFADRLRSNLTATPDRTVNAQITASIKRDGDSSPYIRKSKGTFALRLRDPESAIINPRLTPEISESEESEAQYDIISSFGMFWRREAVKWIATPRLFGMQRIGATPVDFCKQLGIYLLYDGREVIYVGRSTDRPLGTRLYEHTSDRMSTRWDRFSWFGLLPVSEDGELGSLPETHVAAKLIPALEAILIEALEPRQNRKRGDDLGEVEYMQKVDEEIERMKAMAFINETVYKR